MTRLIIVRHAESAFNLQGRIQGHLDSALTPKGVRQACALSKRLFKKFKIDRIYSSDLGRAYSTTLHIVKHTRLKIVPDSRLREINLGAWEGMTPEEVDKLYDKGFQKWLKGPSKCRIPKCEGVKAFRKRIVSRVEAIARENKGKTVLVVTHGGAITCLLSEWLKADFDTLLLHLQVDNTSLTIADVPEKGGIRLLTINDATHVSPRDRDEKR